MIKKCHVIYPCRLYLIEHTTCLPRRVLGATGEKRHKQRHRESVARGEVPCTILGRLGWDRDDIIIRGQRAIIRDFCNKWIALSERTVAWLIARARY